MAKAPNVTGAINFIEISDFLSGDTTGGGLFFGLCLGWKVENLA